MDRFDCPVAKLWLVCEGGCHSRQKAKPNPQKPHALPLIMEFCKKSVCKMMPLLLSAAECVQEYRKIGEKFRAFITVT